MPWIQLKINTTADIADALSDWCSEHSAVSVTFQDTYDTPIFEPLPGETRLWGNTDVIALFEADLNQQQLITQLQHSPFWSDQLSYQFESIEDKDWERAWMDDFQPMQFGQRLWICPSWHTAPDPQAVNVLLDPGLAFGTGTHPTTALCLQWLDSLDLSDKTVIDYGCGSGILAIAALKLGAKQAIGIDIDPQALEASQANAERNQVADRLTLYLAKDKPDNLQADVLVANILAGPLRELAPEISALVKAHGLLALSGVLAEQAPSVAEAYATAFKLNAITEQDEWCRITGCKQA